MGGAGVIKPTATIGDVRRRDRLMAPADACEFLRGQRTAHVATVGPYGWPYVIPLAFVYEGGDVLYLHTGSHEGHFLRNFRADPRLCLEVSEIGPLHPGRPYACNSALVYTSVVAFGPARIEEAPARKSWFFDRLLERYGPPEAEFEPGYPLLDRIVLYEMRLEVVTGNRSFGLRH